MPNPPAPERAGRIRGMFNRIAPCYDLRNRIMTFGQDRLWRREAVARLDPRPGERILDIGAGTGDLAREVHLRSPGSRLVAADFSPGMIAVGRRRPGTGAWPWVVADGLRLPFADRAFDGVVSAFLLRNVADLDRAIAEQFRVLRGGGRFACLETTPPAPGMLRPFVVFYLRRVIPALGGLLAGDSEAYNYLPRSTTEFLPPEELTGHFQHAGFHDVSFQRRMFGTVARHVGRRPAGG